MDRDQALKKIKKCLALAKSSNPNEASAAMRQAQKLMAEHQVTDGDVALADVATQVCSARTNSQPRWEAILARLVADAFGCDLMWSRSAKQLLTYRVVHTREVIFIGVGSAAQVAGYAWDVLSRQCAKDRLAHIRTQSARCKPITRTARGDEFAMGWVAAVASKLQAFTGSQGNTQLIEQYKAATWPDAQKFTPKNRAAGRNVSLNDRRQGVNAGLNAELNHGVDGAPVRGLLT